VVKAVSIALALSLAANVFLGGFVAGRMHGGPPPGPQPFGRPAGGEAMMLLRAAAEQPEIREKFERQFSGQRGKMRADFEELSRLRRALGEALAADPFIRADAEAAAAALSAFNAQREQRGAEFLIDVFETLPAQDRRAIVEKRAQHQKRREERLRDAVRRWRDADEAPPPPEQ